MGRSEREGSELMTQISRTYSFNDANPLIPSQVESEIFNIVNSWNNHENGVSYFTNIIAKQIQMKTGTSTTAPITFTSSNQSLTSTIKYTINNFTIIGDSTNGVNISGNGGNISLGDTSGSYGSGVKVLFIPDRSSAPSSSPTAGCIFYSESGWPRFRTSSGVTGDIVLTSGTQSVAGAKTFTNQVSLDNASGNPIHGTNTNDSPSAGYLGEASSSTAAAAAPTTTQYGDLTSISLTAGDWRVTGLANVSIAANTTKLELGLSTTSGNSATGLVFGDNHIYYATTTGFGTFTDMPMSIPSYRFSLSGTTTVYLKYSGTYTGTSPTFTGTIRAIRVR